MQAPPAGNILVDCRGPDAPGTVGLLPGERTEGVRIPLEEALRLSPAYAGLCDSACEALASSMAEKLRLPRPSALVLARVGLAPLLHAFLDRVIRLDRLASRHASGALAVRSPKPAPAPALVEDFRDLAVTSADFNQVLLARAARCLGVPISDAPGPPPAEPAEGETGIVNHNNRTSASRIRRVWARIWSAYGPRAARRLPCAYLGQETSAARERGLFLDLLDLLPESQPPADPEIDPRLRETVAPAALAGARRELKALLAAARTSERVDPSRTASELESFVGDFLPRSLLEGAPGRWSHAAKRLKPYGSLPLVFSATNRTDHFYLIAAARGLGTRVVCVQHGGHYGYMEDNVQLSEFELPFCDYYLSWGWTELPDRRASLNVKVLPAPSPWMSERKRYWRSQEGALKSASKSTDILLMSDKIKPFPPAPTGASLSRVDTLPDFAETLNALVRATTAAGLSVLHKPYHSAIRSLLGRTLEQLAREGGSLYRTWDRPEKGLTAELLGRAKVVVWDQPGTGMIECMNAGLPTLVLWTRACHRESRAAEPRFRALEEAGVVHRTPEGLAREASALTKDVDGWMASPARKQAIGEFLARFGLADEDWPRRWRETLTALAG